MFFLLIYATLFLSPGSIAPASVTPLGEILDDSNHTEIKILPERMRPIVCDPKGTFLKVQRMGNYTFYSPFYLIAQEQVEKLGESHKPEDGTFYCLGFSFTKEWWSVPVSWDVGYRLRVFTYTPTASLNKMFKPVESPFTQEAIIAYRDNITISYGTKKSFFFSLAQHVALSIAHAEKICRLALQPKTDDASESEPILGKKVRFAPAATTSPTHSIDDASKSIEPQGAAHGESDKKTKRIDELVEESTQNRSLYNLWHRVTR